MTYKLNSYDDFFRMFLSEQEQRGSNYPPYNLVVEDEDNLKYRLEFAVAGFSASDLEITVANNQLILSCTSNEEEQKEERYIHRGLARRSFVKRFKLSSETEVTGSKLVDGILTINMQRVVPDHLKPRKIVIETENSEKQLLTE